MSHFLGLDPEGAGLPPSLAADVSLLDSALGEVLREQEGDALIELARQLYHGEAIPELDDPQTIHKLIRAYTVLFQLLNTAEQKEIVRVNRARQAAPGAKPRSESIAEAVAKLKADGASADSIRSLL